MFCHRQKSGMVPGVPNPQFRIHQISRPSWNILHGAITYIAIHSIFLTWLYSPLSRINNWTLSSVTLVIPSCDVKFKIKVSFTSGNVSFMMITDKLLTTSPGLKTNCPYDKSFMVKSEMLDKVPSDRVYLKWFRKIERQNIKICILLKMKEMISCSVTSCFRLWHASPTIQLRVFSFYSKPVKNVVVDICCHFCKRLSTETLHR